MKTSTLLTTSHLPKWKWFALLLLGLLFISGQANATTYTGTITSTTWSAYNAQTLNAVSWTAAATGGAYWGYDATKGQQFGSAAKPATALSLTTSAIPGTITSITINTSGAASVAGTLSVKVGGVPFTSGGSTSISLTVTSTPYTFTGSATGNIVISWTQTSSKALYLKSISVDYNTSCTPPTLSFATPSYSKTIGDASFTQTATSNSSGAITYASSNTSIASVNSSTGAITLGSTTGTATITATQAASGSYCAATATYTVTVSAGSCTAPSLSFATASYSKMLGDVTFTQTATSNSSGAITYSSSNTSIASVNSSTGAITLGSSTGTATITATQVASGSYCAATATYTINLSAAASSCPIIEGAMINSCGTNEGPNEFLVFSTTSGAAVSAYTLYYGSGSTPKSGASAILAGAAATAKTGTGSVVSSCTVTYVTSPSTVIPANSRVVFIPCDLDQAYDLSALCNGGSLYVVYVGRTSPSSWSLGGNFANSAGDRYLQLVNSSSDCTSNIVMYNSSNFSSNADGNFVSWDSNGNATYSNNGCSVVPPTCTTPIITGTSSVTVGSTTTLSSSLSGGAWSSANTSIATVNASGVVTAIAAGTVDIMYTVGACIGYKTITVTASAACNKVVSQWLFDSGTYNAVAGKGTISMLGGVAASVDNSSLGGETNGKTNSDEVTPVAEDDKGYALEADFSSASSSAYTSGIKIAVNTTGYKNISFQLDMRYSNKSANSAALQYTTDGTTWTTLKTYKVTNSTILSGNTDYDQVWYMRKYNFAGITAVENNSKFAIRLVSIYDGSAFAAATPSKSYSGGKWRFDNVTFTADTISPVVTVTNPAAVCTPNTVDITSVASPSDLDYTYWTNSSATTSLSNPSAISSSATYYIKGTLKNITSTSAACSDIKSVTVTINPLPTALVLTGSTVCSGTTTTITSSTSVLGVNYQLYNSSNIAVGSAVTGTGSALTWSNITAGTGYYVIGTNATTTCTSTSNTVSVVVNSLPTITGTLTICGTGTTTLTGSGTAASSSPWTSATTSKATVSGTSTTGTVTGVAAGTSVITYKDNNGCSKTATVAVNALPTISGTLTICGTSSTTLTGSGTAATTSPWTSATTSTATVSGASTTGTVTGVAAGTSVITYKDNKGCSNTATVTVSTLPSISGVTSGTACSSGTVTLGATASAGTINWYSSLSNTTSLGTGTSYTTGTLNVTTYYYVDATSNGCTSSSRTKVTAKVYPLTTTWKGAVSSDWDDDGNWTNGAPSCCTNVIIDSVGYYPTISSTGCCNNITFDPEAGVLGVQKLVYKKAFIKMVLQRNKWYTLTAPLKNMYSGDYYFNGGTPVSYMRLFDAINPDSLTTGGVKNIGTWTSSFANLCVPLNKGKSFTFNIDTISWNYPHGKTFIKTDQTITFPRMNADSSLITQMIPYAAFTGKPLTLLATTVARYDSAYRFMMENSSNQLTNQTITLQKGLNLIGNPLMTHLNFDNLYNHNSSVIRNVVKFWNGSTFVSYMTGAAIGSSMGLSASSIPPMQSFFVYSDNGGSMTIDLSSDFTSTATGRLRNAQVEPNRLYIKSDNGMKTSSTSLAMIDSAPNNFDNQDAFKLFSQYKDVPEIYTLADNKPLDINQFGTLPYTAPLGIQSSVKDTVALSFTGADSFDGIDVSLINTQTGENQNLKENSTYKYNYDGTNGEGVLFVQFKSANAENTSGVKSNTSGSDIQIYDVNKEKIRAISSPDDLIKDIIVYDETGRTIAQTKGIFASGYDVSVDGANHVCIVKVITNKQVKASKIILK